MTLTVLSLIKIISPWTWNLYKNNTYHYSVFLVLMNTVVVEFFNVNKINESPAIGATSPCWISSIRPAGSRLGSPHAILYKSIYLPCLPLFVLMLAHIIIMRSTFIINICLVAVVSHEFHSISLAWGSEDERINLVVTSARLPWSPSFPWPARPTFLPYVLPWFKHWMVTLLTARDVYT